MKLSSTFLVLSIACMLLTTCLGSYGEEELYASGRRQLTSTANMLRRVNPSDIRYNPRNLRKDNLRPWYRQLNRINNEINLRNWLQQNQIEAKAAIAEVYANRHRF